MAVGHTNPHMDRTLKTRHIADNAVTNEKTGTGVTKIAVFHFAGTDLSAGAKTLTDASSVLSALTLPAGAILKSFYVDVLVPFASDGSATIALGITGAATTILGATAFDDAALTAATADFTMISNTAKLDAAKSVLFTIATAALTGGLANVYIEYVESVA